MKKITLLTFLFIFSVYHSEIIYVSNNGSNLNKGNNILNPVKNIQFAINQSNSGDSIFILRGVYYESISISNTEKHLYISNYKNEEVILSPFTPISSYNWEIHNNNIYKAKTSNKIHQLFIQNKPKMQASFPNINEGVFDLNNAASVYVSAEKAVDFSGASKFNNIKGARFTAICGHKLVALGGKVVNNESNILTISDSSFYWDNNFSELYLGKGKGFLTGNIQFLDSPQEWYYENDYLFYYPQSSNDFSDSTILFRTSLNAIEVINSKNIYVSGLTIFGGNISILNSENCTINNSSIFYPKPFFEFWSGYEHYQPSDVNGKIIYAGPETWTGKGVEISGKNNIIQNCKISHSWGDGLTVYGSENKIENCFIDDCNWMAVDCSILNVSGSKHLITNNTLTNSTRSILSHRFLKQSKISNNDISFGGTLCEDLGLTYCYNTDGDNTEICYNTIHDLLSEKNGSGIYLDNGNYNFNVHHNVVYNCLVGVNINTPSENINLYNNTLYNNKYSMGSFGPTEMKNVYTYNNITDSKEKQDWNYDSFYGSKLDSNLYTKTPHYVDVLNKNFQLKPFTFPVNTGINNAIINEYFDILPDKGAFEYGLTPWKTGSSLILQNKENEIPYPASKLSVVKNTKDSTLLQWEYVHGFIDSYYVQRKKSGETEYKTIKIVDSTFFQFNDTISELGEFRYQILAKNKYGFATPSNSVEVFKNQNVTNGIVLDAENNDVQNGTTITEETIGYLDNKDWIAFKQIDFGKELVDACNIRYAVPCSNAWQNIQIRLDSYMGEIVGEHITENTGDWDKFEIKAFPIKPTTGIHDIYVKFRGKFGIGTLDWFQLYNSNGTVKKTLQKDPKCPQPYTTTSEIPVKLFPNPGNDLLRVSFENKELASAKVEIYNTIGHKISTQSYTELYPGEIELYVDSKALDLGLKSAFYLIKVTIESESHNQETILKYIRL